MHKLVSEVEGVVTEKGKHSYVNSVSVMSTALIKLFTDAEIKTQ